MRLEDMLKVNRKKHGYTQEQVAEKLFVSAQAVSKWEKGLSIPTIDNLLAISDLYDVSLDELVQGSPFFKKPYLVGTKFPKRKALLATSIWLILCWFMASGLGIFAPWIFLLMVIFTILVVFPTGCNDYWSIEQEGIRIKRYDERSVFKLRQILLNKPYKRNLDYVMMRKVEILYVPKVRLSPFDFSCDKFCLKVETDDGTEYLDLEGEPKLYLPQFIGFLKRKGIFVIDRDQIILLLLENKSLYDYFHQIEN